MATGINPGTSGAPGFNKYTWHKLAVSALRDRSTMPYARFHVLMALFDRSGRKGDSIYLGTLKLAEELSIDRRHLVRHVKALTIDGWLIVTEYGGNAYGKGMANVYRLGNGPSPKGGTECTKGGTECPTRGAVDATPSSHLPSPFHHSANKLSGSFSMSETKSGGGDTEPDPWNVTASSKSAEQREQIRPDWEAMREDIELLEEYLDEQGLDDGLNGSTISGMWEDGMHPLAIANTLAKGLAS